MTYLPQDRALTRRLADEGATWLSDVLWGLTVGAIFVGLVWGAALLHAWASQGML